MPLIYRIAKGSKLTIAEMDGNFNYLDNKIDQVETIKSFTLSNVRSTNISHQNIIISDYGKSIWSLDASDTTSIDNTGTVVVAANGSRYKRVFQGVADLTWFGGKPDYNGTSGTDNSSFINAMISTMSDVYITIPQGKWYFSQPIVLPTNKNVFIDILGSVYFPAGSDGIIVESNNSSYIMAVSVTGGIYSQNAGSISTRTGAGLKIKNCYNRRFEANIIEGFGDGILVYGDSGNGSQYNQIKFEKLRNNKNSIRITATGIGDWCNQNQFYCGEVRGYNGLVFDHGAGTSTDPFNGNIFYGLGVEQCTNRGIVLDFCQYNTFFSGRTSDSENTAPYLYTFTDSAKYNTFNGFALYEGDFENGIKLNTFIGCPIFTASGTLSSMINLQGLNIVGAYSNTAMNETVNDSVALVRTQKKNSTFANVKTNGKTQQVDFTKKYQFVPSNSTTANLNDPIGFVRVNSSSNCTLTLNADELNTAISNTYTSFFVDIRSAVNCQILSGIDASVLVSTTQLPSTGFYQVLYTQSDWKVYRLDRDMSNPVLIGRNTVTSNMQVGTASGSSYSMFMGANGQDQMRFHPDSLRISVYGFLSNRNTVNNGYIDFPDTGILAVGGNANSNAAFEAYLSNQNSTGHIANFRNYETLASWIDRKGFFKSPYSAATLDFPSVAANSEGTALTITVPGAAVGDFAFVVPNVKTAGISYEAYVSATDTVSVYPRNCTSGPLDPPSGTFRATVIKA